MRRIYLGHYEITGVDKEGKRFKMSTKSHIQAMGINLWRGSVWFIKDGETKRKLVKRVWN